jgi:elongation factor 3
LQNAAVKTLDQLCKVIDNKDIKNVLPKIMSSIANPSEVSQCIHLLSATTFVQTVEASALSVMVPLLLRGLRTRETAIKRKSALIIDNMSRVCPHDCCLAWLLQILSRIYYLSCWWWFTC